MADGTCIYIRQLFSFAKSTARTQIYCRLPLTFVKIDRRELYNKLTCLEMTSGDRGVSFEGSMSIFGIGSATSSSSSESDSSACFWSVSSPGMWYECRWYGQIDECRDSMRQTKSTGLTQAKNKSCRSFPRSRGHHQR